MKANELRIGNWINAEVNGIDQYVQVFEINEDTLNGFKGILRTAKGIPLTKHWCERLRMTSSGGVIFKIKVSDDREIQVDLSDIGDMWAYIETVCDYVSLGPCDYVHQLQNIYFTRTGIELKINM
ncbi:MAG TPA: hypothetical protein VIM65_20645 [Cyclobacteriaceae bacterium]